MMLHGKLQWQVTHAMQPQDLSSSVSNCQCAVQADAVDIALVRLWPCEFNSIIYTQFYNHCQPLCVSQTCILWQQLQWAACAFALSSPLVFWMSQPLSQEPGVSDGSSLPVLDFRSGGMCLLKSICAFNTLPLLAWGLVGCCLGWRALCGSASRLPFPRSSTPQVFKTHSQAAGGVKCWRLRKHAEQGATKATD